MSLTIDETYDAIAEVCASAEFSTERCGALLRDHPELGSQWPARREALSAMYRAARTEKPDLSARVLDALARSELMASPKRRSEKALDPLLQSLCSGTEWLHGGHFDPLPDAHLWPIRSGGRDVLRIWRLFWKTSKTPGPDLRLILGAVELGEDIEGAAGLFVDRWSSDPEPEKLLGLRFANDKTPSWGFRPSGTADVDRRLVALAMAPFDSLREQRRILVRLVGPGAGGHPLLRGAQCWLRGLGYDDADSLDDNPWADETSGYAPKSLHLRGFLAVLATVDASLFATSAETLLEELEQPDLAMAILRSVGADEDATAEGDGRSWEAVRCGQLVVTRGGKTGSGGRLSLKAHGDDAALLFVGVGQRPGHDSSSSWCRLLGAECDSERSPGIGIPGSVFIGSTGWCARAACILRQSPIVSRAIERRSSRGLADMGCR